MTSITLHPGDNILSMRAMAENSVHSVVTDPPYMLESIVKRFGKDGSAPARTAGNDGSFARLSAGFLNKKWDSPQVELPPLSSDFGHYMAGLIDGEGCFHVHKKLVNNCETYDCQFSINLRSDDRAILVEMQRQLGGIGSLADRPARDNANSQVRFCISSKVHCQILRSALTVFPLRAKKARDFEIWCHALDAWLNHEPKSSWDDVSFYRDQLMMVKRFGGLYKPEFLFHYRWAKEALRVLKPGGCIFAFSGSRTGHWQAAAMELAGFIMHPMHGWCFGSGMPKPTNLKSVSGFEGWGYGTQTQKPALEPIYLGQKPFSEKTGPLNVLKHGVGGFNLDDCSVPSVDGYPRRPSNLILDGSPEVVAMFPGSKGKRDNSGSAARFFHRFGPDADPLIYHGKADKIDRAGGSHPTVKPIALMQYLIRHITPPGGIVLDPFAGSGTTAEAARKEGFDCILMEAETEYVEFLERRFPEINDHNQKMLLSDEQLDDYSFTVCSHSKRKGLNSYLSDLIGENVDLSDLM